MSGEPTPPPGTRRSRRRPAPTSLPTHFTAKGHLSVSDLVAPSWCEYNYLYSILSLSHLPPSLRPATITTESGQTLSAAPQLVERKETTLQAGKAVHEVLEKEVAGVEVKVEVVTEEDRWALRLINMWCDVRGLTEMQPEKGKGKGCVREVPVYGWVHGVFVRGVIDEISKRSIDLGPQKEDIKKWASQEDWKKDQQRKHASPKKTKNGASSSSRPLTSFFNSSQSKQPDPPMAGPAERKPVQGWGYFLSDTKTRLASWLPTTEDQHSARMQCMTYRRLFDGLLLSALPASSLSVDPNATPMDWDHTFTSLNLDPHEPLSEAFMRDAEPVCQSWGVDLRRWVVEKGADVCTLHHIRLLLEEALRGLVDDARRGAGTREEMGRVAVIQDQLALTYRRQKTWRKGKRKKAAPARAERGGESQMTLQDTISGAMEDTQSDSLEEAISATTEATQSAALEDTLAAAIDAVQDDLGTIDADPPQQSLDALSSPPPTITATPDSPTSPIPSTSILGIVTFDHDPSLLDAYLLDTIRMWKGDRSLRGVRLDQTRRCWTCEWIDGCEWRSSQAERLAKVEAPVPVSLENQEGSQAGVGEGEGEGEGEGAGEFSDLDYDSIQLFDVQGNVIDW